MNSKKMVFILLFVLLSLFIEAQETHEGVTFNPKVGLSITGAPGPLGGVLGFEVSLRRNKLIHSVSVLRVKEFDFFFLSPEPANSFNQLDYLFGEYQDKGKVRFQCQVGVGLLYGYERDKFLYRESGMFGTKHYSSKWYTAIALPIKVGLKKLLKNGNTLGLDTQINISKKNIIIMPLLSYEF